MEPSFWIILTGSLVAACCSILGCFLVLRKMSMVADAISHAILPGIAIAFFITNSRDSIPMLIGAAAFGLLTTFIIEWLHKKARLQKDASIGMTFTWLFSIGVILISLFAHKVDLDQDCILYGEIEYITFDAIAFSPTFEVPVATLILAGLLLFILAFLIVGYKGLYITTFDASYASAIGISVALWHYLLMGAVSITSVVSFESVGAILVIAFMIAPAATAYLLTDKLKPMLIIAVLVGTLAAFGGYYLSVALKGSIAGAMTTVLGFEFLLAFLFAPKTGLVTRRFVKVQRAIH